MIMIMKLYFISAVQQCDEEIIIAHLCTRGWPLLCSPSPDIRPLGTPCTLQNTKVIEGKKCLLLTL